MKFLLIFCLLLFNYVELTVQHGNFTGTYHSPDMSEKLVLNENGKFVEVSYRIRLTRLKGAYSVSGDTIKLVYSNVNLSPREMIIFGEDTLKYLDTKIAFVKEN